MPENNVMFWFRRDLRLNDNAGLYQALKNGSVIPVFIFDSDILEMFDNRSDERVMFIYQQLENIKRELQLLGSDLLVLYGKPHEVWEILLEQYKIKQVFCNHDYEPEAIARDQVITDLLERKGISFHSFKDQCIFEKNEVIKDDGKPYTVFTPYSKKWKNKLNTYYLRSYPSEKYFSNFFKASRFSKLIKLKEMNFIPVPGNYPDNIISDKILSEYAELRNYPSANGTTRIGIHLRFGTVSIRQMARKAIKLSETWLNELIWRDFYMQILFHFPYVAKSAFRPEYNLIKWRNNEKEFEKWCNGQTGYPIVDAGMRELNTTGFMHNRLRMVVASFLTKHLLIDWRWGEAYFAQKLLDFDLSANNGGWQWAAGCGTDAAPYFRIFSPALQTEKFDPQKTYIKKWVQEYGTPQYAKPMVNHEEARKRCLEVYKHALAAK
ncbi:MAG: deoxyribodipyrimidine photo-lyase [Bacteroidia bacterium]|nr:deoxyribodipyrimidine photo-lyase [Bacteroidia bacterium]